MQLRLNILDQHGLGINEIQEVIATLSPLDGAADFLNWLRARFQVVILSDTFYQFAGPLMAQLGNPTLLCHNLEVSDEGRVVNYHLRQNCLLYTSPSPRDLSTSRMPSSA